MVSLSLSLSALILLSAPEMAETEGEKSYLSRDQQRLPVRHLSDTSGGQELCIFSATVIAY